MVVRLSTKVTVEEFITKLSRIIEKGGKVTIKWGVGDVYLGFGLTFTNNNLHKTVKFRVFIFDSTYKEEILLIEKNFSKIELDARGADIVESYADSEGVAVDYYMRGNISVVVAYEEATSLTRIVVESK
jgi:hypothetical protein